MSSATYLPMLDEVEKASIRERQPLPERVSRAVDEDALDARMAAAREALGDRLVILGHHYQRDEVIRFADYTGDSFKLSREIAKHPKAEFIVFCGVHFMAESADILALPHQQVILPDLAAGCSMADMAPDRPARAVLGRARADGRGAATSCRSPTSTRRRRLRGSSASAAAPSAPRRMPRPCSAGAGSRSREDPVPARPAPGPQHGVLPHGRAARPDGRVGSVRAVRRPHPRTARQAAADPLEGPLLGARALHREADRPAARSSTRACA